MKSALLFFSLSLLSFTASAQDPDSLIRLLVDKHIMTNSARLSTPGFRIQVFSGNTRIPANEVRSRIIRSYPDVPTYLLYHQPHFKVRIGDFRTRLEAMKLLVAIQKDFPNAFVVKDEIKLPDLR